MSRSVRPEKWVVSPPVEHNAAIRMFCFPPAGGGAALYRLWPQKLPSDLAVYRIQPPGRETRFREQLLRDLARYEDALMAELQPLLDRPFVFFGHSMGSLIAFRMARRIRQDLDRQPLHLFVSAFRSPTAPPMKRIFDLPHDEFIRELRETYDGIPDQLLNEPEILELMLPIVRADLQIVAGHVYDAQRPLDCPISAFGGIDDHWVDEAQLSEWASQTSAEFTLSMFPGNHYYLNPAQDQLFAAIAASLR